MSNVEFNGDFVSWTVILIRALFNEPRRAFHAQLIGHEESFQAWWPALSARIVQQQKKMSPLGPQSAANLPRHALHVGHVFSPHGPLLVPPIDTGPKKSHTVASHLFRHVVLVSRSLLDSRRWCNERNKVQLTWISRRNEKKNKKKKKRTAREATKKASWALKRSSDFHFVLCLARLDIRP